MSTNKKPRSDSKLKTLRAERQADIFARLNLPAPAGGYAAVVAWLREDGFQTSTTALSEFFSWYSLQQQLTRNQSTVETLLVEAQKADPGLTAEKIQAMGQAFFSALALESQDVKVWYATQRLALRLEQLDLDREKLELLKQKAAQADAAKVVAGDKALTPEQRDAEYRRIFGMGA